ncbi:uncharacterized protein LOC131164434 [Malania oleifera]|uniref:uncharacterized protein LOC131164434 n=1 Tax=Malania oleifera TaxID=397392 RepID=UPI0025AE9137|nr:uncharacterized protein LOC131164434 [Malania oleifera]
MDFHMNHGQSSPSSSSAASDPNPNPSSGNHNDPMHSWWESISKARSRILSLSSVLPPSSSLSVSSLADSDRPARSLLASSAAYDALSDVLSSPNSGSGSDPLCHWLYDTFHFSDPDLRLVSLSLVPLLAGLYLSRVVSDSSPSLAGFEAVLLALYASETKARAGKPIHISIPDLSQPSLYHTPRTKPAPGAAPAPVPSPQSRSSVGVVSAPLEPQMAVKSTKRACIVGVALDCFYKQISQMPSWSKLELCQFAAAWAGQNCPCKGEFDEYEMDGFSMVRDITVGGDEIETMVQEIQNLEIGEDNTNLGSKGSRIPLPWELLQPILRILGHCLLAPLNSQDVMDAASVAVRCLYARASHDLVPQAILATRSLIQLDKRARSAAKAAATNASNANTPSKAKKPEILLVSK